MLSTIYYVMYAMEVDVYTHCICFCLFYIKHVMPARTLRLSQHTEQWHSLDPT